MKGSNKDVPIQTVFRHKCREAMKLKKRVTKLEMTVESLRNNITLILRDPAIKHEIAVDLRVREANARIAILERKLHEERESNNRLIEKLVKYEQQESVRSVEEVRESLRKCRGYMDSESGIA